MCIRDRSRYLETRQITGESVSRAQQLTQHENSLSEFRQSRCCRTRSELQWRRAESSTALHMTTAMEKTTKFTKRPRGIDDSCFSPSHMLGVVLVAIRWSKLEKREGRECMTWKDVINPVGFHDVGKTDQCPACVSVSTVVT